MSALLWVCFKIFLSDRARLIFNQALIPIWSRKFGKERRICTGKPASTCMANWTKKSPYVSSFTVLLMWRTWPLFPLVSYLVRCGHLSIVATWPKSINLSIVITWPLFPPGQRVLTCSLCPPSHCVHLAIVSSWPLCPPGNLYIVVTWPLLLLHCGHLSCSNSRIGGLKKTCNMILNWKK